ncbi:MAG: hydrolase [Peptococcaceae bacterium]|jgi:nicotinamidase-related amidase|nr:hydrolase [Peptococcaceae bacterium]
MRILKENTAGVVIDMQEGLLPHIAGKEELTRNLIILIKGLKQYNIPMLVTQQYTKGLGTTVYPVKEALGEYTHIEKNSFSCCDEAVFKERIASLGKRFIIIAGIETHVCVLQTVIDLLEQNYLPVVIEDCVSSRKESDRRVALERMRQEGAIVSTYESILFELCRYAGTDTFKAISRLVK